jgi:hypothetical protein
MTIVLRPRCSVELATLLVSNREGIIAHHFAHLLCVQHVCATSDKHASNKNIANEKKRKIPAQNLSLKLKASKVRKRKKRKDTRTESLLRAQSVQGC